MKKLRNIYGLLGFVSLLGFIGILTNERRFLSFFGFAICFLFFTVRADEMFEGYMHKSATRAFLASMFVTPIVTSIHLLMQSSGQTAILTGFSCGWAASVLVFFLSASYYIIRENWRIGNDKE